MTSFGDLQAGGALAARGQFLQWILLAENGLGEMSGERPFAHAFGADKEIRSAQAPAAGRAAKSFPDRVVPDQAARSQDIVGRAAHHVLDLEFRDLRATGYRQLSPDASSCSRIASCTCSTEPEASITATRAGQYVSSSR